MDNLPNLQLITPPTGLTSLRSPSFPNIDKDKYYFLVFTEPSRERYEVVKITNKTDEDIECSVLKIWSGGSWRDTSYHVTITPDLLQSGEYKFYEPIPGGKRKKTRRTRKSKKTRKHVSKRR